MLQLIKFWLVIMIALLIIIVVFPLCLVNWDWRIYSMISAGIGELLKNWIDKP